MKKNNDSPSDDASMVTNSRRKFLVGAGAAGVSLAFLNRAAHAANTEAQAVTCAAPAPPCTSNCPTPVTPPGSPTDNPPPTGCINVNKIPSPNPYLIRGCCTDTVCGYNAAGITVTGVRHYCGLDIIPWGTSTSNPTGTPFPGRPDNASFCMTIYPTVSKLLSGEYDGDLLPFMKSFFPRDMISCWHELAGGKEDASGYCIQPADALAMQKYLLDFRNSHNLTTPAIGAIECGNGAANFGVDRCGPWMMEGLDFYGNDLYHKNYGNAIDALTAWDNAFGHGSKYTPTGVQSKATIAVCECNCAADDEAGRATYYNDAAWWLWNQGNKGPRCFLTFWNYSGAASESGPWDPNDTNTISALQKIGNGIYTAPSS
jgi:hypothetical protein